MSEELSISLDELQQAENLFFARLKADGHVRFDFAVDYYWDWSPKDRYNPNEESEAIGLGCLDFDIENLRDMVSSGVFPSGKALIVLAAILRAVGETCDV